MSGPKPYGLILPGQQKKAAVIPTVRETLKPSIFDESSDDSDGNANAPPQMKTKSAPALGVMERRMARRAQEKALEEDPTVYQYDELYDEIENKREEEKQSRSKDPKKPKYIERLMVVAERRKLENELRVERQVQKEREQEGEEFKDKESFVTAAYRKKLEEMRLLEEQEKRDEYLESIGDVTKQKDLDGFYRHLYEQKVGTQKDVQKPGMPNTSAGDEEIAYKPIKSGKPSQQRAYRKRQASDDDEEEVARAALAATEAKKVHLQNNIDADSDFSIDSSSDEDDDNDKAESTKNTKGKQNEQSSKVSETDPAKIALKLETLKKEKDAADDKDKDDEASKLAKEVMPPPETPPKTKTDKSLIWKKRTVGEAFDAALQRYFERKATRAG